jgi:hypothetical protein
VRHFVPFPLELSSSTRRCRIRVRTTVSFLDDVMSGVQLVANAYLDDNTAKIRFKPVPWEVHLTLHPSMPSMMSGLFVWNISTDLLLVAYLHRAINAMA